MPYALRGPLPAGDYHLYAGGYQSAGDAKLHADVVWRSAAGDQPVVSADSNIGPGSDAGTPGTIDVTLTGPAINAACGDQLILSVHVVSGTSDYIEFGANLKIP
ncbi:MAG TPA: hypothetical protein VFF06_14950 [Polyangia bacterium]|nr:hypothetical protein [Polyangia bacterium]